jgi:hypothetical protein
MYPDSQSPPPSSPGKESANSVRIHSSPSPRFSNPTASGSALDGNKSRTRPVAAILRDVSSSFDQKSCVVVPFDNEVRRDAEFYQSQFWTHTCAYHARLRHGFIEAKFVSDLKEKQLEVIALMNSWVFARLIVENERAGEALSREMDALAEAEREQGRSLLPRLLLSCLPGTHVPSF